MSLARYNALTSSLALKAHRAFNLSKLSESKCLRALRFKRSGRSIRTQNNKKLCVSHSK